MSVIIIIIIAGKTGKQINQDGKKSVTE